MPASGHMIAKQKMIHIAFQTLEDIIWVAEKDFSWLSRILFWSPPNAATTYGPGWFFHLTRQAREKTRFSIQTILDCGHRPDLVQLSLSLGIKKICFQGPPITFKKLEQISSFYQAELYGKPEQEILSISHLNKIGGFIKEYLKSTDC